MTMIYGPVASDGRHIENCWLCHQRIRAGDWIVLREGDARLTPAHLGCALADGIMCDCGHARQEHKTEQGCTHQDLKITGTVAVLTGCFCPAQA